MDRAGRRYLLPGGPRYEDEPAQITHPRFWAVARYNSSLQPVVGVSWYEAAAYCRWLTDEGHQHGWLPRDELIRLPTWHEWERAARHTDQRRYPWGDNPPDPERANYRDTRLGAPSPIGSFPSGVAACGAHDMLGNVLEWTASPWHRWDVWRKDFTTTERITLSWTYFVSSTDELFCGARSGSSPFDWSSDWGFRVVQSCALTE